MNTFMVKKKVRNEALHARIGPMLLDLQGAFETVDKLTAALKALNPSDEDWKEIISGLKLSPEIRQRVVGNDCLTDMVEVLSKVPDMTVDKIEEELLARGQQLHRIRQSISQNAGLRKKIEWADAKKTKLRLAKK